MSKYLDRRRTVRLDAPQDDLERGLERAQARQLGRHEAEQDRLQAQADARDAEGRCPQCGHRRVFWCGTAGCPGGGQWP